GMHDRGHGTDGAELTAALHPEEIGLAWRALVEGGVHRREIGGARNAIVHERSGQQLATVGVVHRLLEKRLSRALGDAAVHLTLNDHVVDDAPDVVAAREADDGYGPGFAIDLHFACLRAVGPRRRRRS